MGLMKRSDSVAFYGVSTSSGEPPVVTTVYHRMTNFTDMKVSKNPKEYSRRYIDEDFERSDVIGYGTSVSYAFDLDPENAVHSDLKAIADEERLGEDTARDIIMVDMTSAGGTAGSFNAVKRSFSVIPDGEGEGTDSYAYNGTFKVRGSRITGEAATADDWKTITFTPDAV